MPSSLGNCQVLFAPVKSTEVRIPVNLAAPPVFGRSDSLSSVAVEVVKIVPKVVSPEFKLMAPVPPCKASEEAVANDPTVTTDLPVPAPVPAPMLIVWVLPVAVLALPIAMVFEAVDWPMVVVPVVAVEPMV